jgi:hypothetical protein
MHTWKEILAVPLSRERSSAVRDVFSSCWSGTGYYVRTASSVSQGDEGHGITTDPLSLYLSSISDRGGSVISDI